ncbi:hypothetical protein KCP75_10045 [Salmonella enterica subsp. enterica]|nr:hypothetical protein KCP75_10045 [Salmonella enterica subsp. enterica]
MAWKPPRPMADRPGGSWHVCVGFMDGSRSLLRRLVSPAPEIHKSILACYLMISAGSCVLSAALFLATARC